MSAEWIVVLEAPLSDASDAWRSWLVAHDLDEDALDPDVVRVDTICATGGDVRRYRLRREAAAALGLVDDAE